MPSGSTSRSSMGGTEAAPVIAMAFATVSAGAPVRVRNCRNVATSFPGFEAVAGAAGLHVEVVDGRD